MNINKSTIKETVAALIYFGYIVFLNSGHDRLLGAFEFLHDLPEGIVFTLLLLLLGMGLVGRGIVEQSLYILSPDDSLTTKLDSLDGSIAHIAIESSTTQSKQ